MNRVIEKKPGKPISEHKKKEITRKFINSDKNLRMKTSAGNRNDTKDGLFADQTYTNDRYLDQCINDAIKNGTNLTNAKAVGRLNRIWKIVNLSSLDYKMKAQIRHELSQIKDQEGKVIIRSNASIDVTNTSKPTKNGTPNRKAKRSKSKTSAPNNNASKTINGNFYTGGQFTPAGGRAPAGGVSVTKVSSNIPSSTAKPSSKSSKSTSSDSSTISVGIPQNFATSHASSKSTSSSLNSSTSAQNSVPSNNASTTINGKFYAGGQFTPAGGRAPAGGVYC